MQRGISSGLSSSSSLASWELCLLMCSSPPDDKPLSRVVARCGKEDSFPRRNALQNYLHINCLKSRFPVFRKFPQQLFQNQLFLERNFYRHCP